MPVHVKTRSGDCSTHLKRSVEIVIPMKMILLGQAADEVVNFLVDVVKLGENLFGELCNGFRPSSFRHDEKEGVPFNNLCVQFIRWVRLSSARQSALSITCIKTSLFKGR